MTFSNRQILVVEDDLIQAMDIEMLLGQTGASVLGPVSSIEEGVKYLNRADAAVLDITLKDREVFPLADMLHELQIPFVFYSGIADTSGLPERFRDVQLIRKPMETLPEAAIVALQAFPAAYDDNMIAILPKLRLAARLMYLDSAASDRLVERVLIDAIEHVKKGRDLGSGPDKAHWLLSRMRNILEERGSELMN